LGLRLWLWRRLALDDTILGSSTWANVSIVVIVLRRCLSLGCLPELTIEHGLVPLLPFSALLSHLGYICLLL
jgi:hypothetical protein